LLDSLLQEIALPGTKPVNSVHDVFKFV